MIVFNFPTRGKLSPLTTIRNESEPVIKAYTIIMLSFHSDIFSVVMVNIVNSCALTLCFYTLKAMHGCECDDI